MQYSVVLVINLGSGAAVCELRYSKAQRELEPRILIDP